MDKRATRLPEAILRLEISRAAFDPASRFGKAKVLSVETNDYGTRGFGRPTKLLHARRAVPAAVSLANEPCLFGKAEVSGRDRPLLLGRVGGRHVRADGFELHPVDPGMAGPIDEEAEGEGSRRRGDIQDD